MPPFIQEMKRSNKQKTERLASNNKFLRTMKKKALPKFKPYYRPEASEVLALIK